MPSGVLWHQFCNDRRLYESHILQTEHTAMKRLFVILGTALLLIAAAGVIGQRKSLSPKEERREQREKRRAQRLADYERMIDSLVRSRNFQFNPQTMQQQPAGPFRNRRVW